MNCYAIFPSFFLQKTYCDYRNIKKLCFDNFSLIIASILPSLLLTPNLGLVMFKFNFPWGLSPKI